MGKPDGLSRRSGEEKSRLDAHFFDARQLLYLEINNIGEEEDAENLELEGIDVAIWQKKNGLWVVPQEHRLEVL